MPFVKLDCEMLRSSIWIDRLAREVFITALLMAEPQEFTEPIEQIAVRTLDYTGYVVPPGWYGFVPASGCGIVRYAVVEQDPGMDALERLCSPDPDSRNGEFEGRRMARINGGYLVLSFMRYRDRDYSGADRSRRYRERLKASRRDGNGGNANDTPKRDGVTREPRVVTHAECRVQSSDEYQDKTKISIPSESHSNSKQFDGPVTEVFEHWKATWNHPRARLDKKRTRAIKDALKAGYSGYDLLQSISGYLNSPYHTGKNERQTVYDDLALFLRDAAHIDAGIRFFSAGRPDNFSEATRRIIDQTADWQPPEVRNAKH